MKFKTSLTMFAFLATAVSATAMSNDLTLENDVIPQHANLEIKKDLTAEQTSFFYSERIKEDQIIIQSLVLDVSE